MNPRPIKIAVREGQDDIVVWNGHDLGFVVPHFSYDRAQLIVNAGRRGYGKTTGIQAYVNVREPRAFIVDHYDDFPDVLISPSVEAALADLGQGGPCRRRVVPDLGASDDISALGIFEWADSFFDQCYTGLTDCLVVANEISLLSKPVASPSLTRFVTQGRRRGLRMACDAQRLAQVPYVIQSECTQLITFRVSRPRDTKALEDWCDEDIAQLARTLDVGQCVVVTL